MKTLGMFITMSFLINETGQAKDLQDLTLANDTITESIIQAGGQKKSTSCRYCISQEDNRYCQGEDCSGSAIFTDKSSRERLSGSSI